MDRKPTSGEAYLFYQKFLSAGLDGLPVRLNPRCLSYDGSWRPMLGFNPEMKRIAQKDMNHLIINASAPFGLSDLPPDDLEWLKVRYSLQDQSWSWSVEMFCWAEVLGPVYILL